MVGRHVLLIAAFVASSCSPLMAIEGPTAAGPIGGTDIRSALLPPPGVYGGTMQLGAATLEFLDGNLWDPSSDNDLAHADSSHSARRPRPSWISVRLIPE